MIAFQQIILLKNYEVKMHQRFCKPDKKIHPCLPPPKKIPVPKKEWAPAVSEVQELFISKVQKQIIKLTSHSLSLEKNSTHDGQYIQSFHFWRKTAFKPEKSWAQHKIINLRQLTKKGNSIFLTLIYRNLIWSNIFLQPFNSQKWLKSNFSF